MLEPIDNRSVCEVCKDFQARLANREGMRSEMREGFASLRAQIAIKGPAAPIGSIISSNLARRGRSGG